MLFFSFLLLVNCYYRHTNARGTTINATPKEPVYHQNAGRDTGLCEEKGKPYRSGEIFQLLPNAVITESDGTFYAKVPDISGCITTAGSLSEAISLITDALNLSLVVLEDEDIEPQHPTPQSEIVHGDNDILTVIQVNT